MRGFTQRVWKQLGGLILGRRSKLVCTSLMQFFQIIQKCYGHRDLPNCVRIQSISHQYHMLFSTLLTGNTEITTEYPRRVQRLVNSSGQDIIFGVTGGRQKPPKQILLSYAVKTLTNAVELIQVLNRREHGIAYSQIEEINTARWLQKMALTPDNEVTLPENIQFYVNTALV